MQTLPRLTVLSRRLVLQSRRSASSTATSPASTTATSTGFFTPFWRNVTLGVVATVAAVKFLDRLPELLGHKEEEGHPITAFISYWMTPEEVNKRKRYEAISAMREAAQEQYLMQDCYVGFRPVAPEMLDRSSPFNNIPGENVDMEDLRRYFEDHAAKSRVDVLPPVK